ncbi:3-phenylpropionate/trans-cinnamate dioxygenase ferredoxin subunit [Trinickia symbiotica]|uniref:Non-heme iron oxygenase ferredoxin subunit n=1 Tax=Trinickia symbiotica TaxID=863227 RepID=A0A2N7WWN8_9BURK|nr:non-heme iron oxygenase ferredoxin subunit [Trinickia symbiotica]PMS33918.1 non-heme iron oxygenase ferredoxin subunit [Trinickia symbiotica]PPK42528.1 3-phenylpropionate/trans-cinnamate dioxygenase ferredoxin subunit [Trinickia symbiotica]
MSDWFNVAKLDEFAPGSVRSVNIDGTQVAVFNVGGEYFAIEDLCTHDGGVLTGGTFDGDVVVCPRHGARFCVKTGKALSPPAYEDVAVFPVRLEAGVVQVRDARWD